MQIIDGIFTDTLTLNSYEVDTFYSAQTAFYFRIMQEAAGAHAYYRNVSIPHLQQEGKTWVVTRTRMEILEHVRWPNTVQVHTWPQQPWKLYFPRVCQLYSGDQTKLFQSISHWVVMDTEKQRPVKPQTVSDRFGSVQTDEFVDPNLGRRVMFDIQDHETVLTYHPVIRYSDCDFNRHVNNVVYLEWMLDSLPFSFRDSHQAYEVDISYLAQTFRDDTVLVRTGLSRSDILRDDQVKLVHEIVRTDDEGKLQPVSTAVTKWKPRSVNSGAVGVGAPQR